MISIPENRIVQGGIYAIGFKPVKKSSGFFSLFEITIENKSGSNMIVDWVITRYLYNGKPMGVFLWKGIEPGGIKKMTIPPDVIPPGARLKRQIAPYKRVSYAPIRDKSEASLGIAVRAGPLPMGNNGILLVFGLDGEIFREILSVTLAQDKGR